MISIIRLHIPSFVVKYASCSNCSLCHKDTGRFATTSDGKTTRMFLSGLSDITSKDFKFTPTSDILQACNTIIKDHSGLAIADDQITNILAINTQLDSFLKARTIDSSRILPVYGNGIP